MRKSDFREDRDWSYDPPPLDDALLSEKLRFQRRLRERCKSAELPSDYPWSDPSDLRWWTSPTGISPEEEDRRRKEYEARQEKLSNAR